ncbi:thiol:disulfide interchange protein [Candidatus Photodesmus katoptron]|uniref:Thiol:disulfide interchange protein DsbE n=1 Tax=Candidatus Photodesmus katoptron Akat1 TaxID=1236703 RepID=S3DGU6_9GAMM|nr:DsbE family thiol:disulfide interchange protein [Candidatus Photodesmus katoptron]EPE37692.1 thiol:disulfide interchange protein DsbE [Candidatus Photodesmus katoptron Akat1]KEY90587.1 thiol:disulfide interchange protein [Candidatus Photodesmus katoptron]
MKKLILFIPLIGFLGLVFIFSIQLFYDSERENSFQLESMLIGKKIPSFILEDVIELGKFHNETIFQGKQPTLLNVWATWCPTCYSEHQYLHELENEGVKIIGLNYRDKRSEAIKWLNKFGNPYVINLFDWDNVLGFDLGVYGAPETFLIDKEAIVRYRYVGKVDPNIWNKMLKPIYISLLDELK